jgi:hypothetical protein
MAKAPEGMRKAIGTYARRGGQIFSSLEDTRCILAYARGWGSCQFFLVLYSSSPNSTSDESKRDLLYRLFPQIEHSHHGPAVITKMAKSLAEQDSFPDLENWEDSAEKKRNASAAVLALREYLRRANEEVADARERAEIKERVRATREYAAQRRENLAKLATRLDLLAAEIGSQDAGYRFQDWYYDLAEYFEVISRRPYVAEGRQIDGSVTIDGTTYLTELKFTREQAGAPDIDIFLVKVQNKADNTMGIMVSMSGYSSVALKAASGPKTPLLLLDHSHLYFLLSGPMTLEDVVKRVRRHSSQTGQAYLPVGDFGG